MWAECGECASLWSINWPARHDLWSFSGRIHSSLEGHEEASRRQRRTWEKSRCTGLEVTELKEAILILDFQRQRGLSNHRIQQVFKHVQACYLGFKKEEEEIGQC